MSGSIEAEKLRQYRHLLPSAPAEMLDKIDSGTPEEISEAETVPEETSVAVPPADWPALAETAARDRARGCMLGLAVGNAIGAAAVSKPRGGFPGLTGMTGGGAFDLRPGEWTGDTAMALCLAESLIAMGTVDQRDFMQRLGRWMQAGENSVTGACFDIGPVTRDAIDRFLAGGSAASGSANADTADNGSLTRLAPIAVLSRANGADAEFLALKQSRATHGAMECLDACKLLTSMLVDALAGAGRDAAIRPRVMALSPRLLLINAGEWRGKSRDDIRSGGSVVETLEAAVWAVGTTDSFASAVLAAANLGDDADSVAAVAGQLAGAIYGASAIPPDWIGVLAWREKIEALADGLFDLA
jgi:ADP-ribosyl-[dinitrogen reductase] hydrolase